MISKKEQERVKKNNPPYIIYEGFIKTLIETKKYKDLFNTKEAILSFIMSIIILYFTKQVYLSVSIELFNEIIRDTTGIFIAGILGLLGIVISGLTFTAGSMNIKITKKMVEQSTIHLLIDIFFSFKFIGVIMGIELFGLMSMYLCSYIDFPVTIYSLNIIGFLLIYLFLFSVNYCIGLLGTCINTFLLNYNLSDDK